MSHFLTWPTSSTAVCGADVVGQRNSARDTDPEQTTCQRCRESAEWAEAALKAGLAEDAAFRATVPDKEWYEDRGMALWYMWGRMDMGEKRDVNDNWVFAEKWADAKRAFRNEARHSLPSLQDALKWHDEGKGAL